MAAGAGYSGGLLRKKGKQTINWFPGLKGKINLGQQIMQDVTKFGAAWPSATRDQVTGQGNNAVNEYQALLNSMMEQQRADARSESVADAASRDAVIKRLFASYGDIPELAGLSAESQGVLPGILTPELAELARQNTAAGTSIKARMAEADMLRRRQASSGRARSGTLRSGATGEDERRNALLAKTQNFDVMSELLQNVEGAVGGFASNERQRQRMLAQQEQENAMRAWEFAQATQMNQPSQTEEDTYWLSEQEAWQKAIDALVAQGLVGTAARGGPRRINRGWY